MWPSHMASAAIESFTPPYIRICHACHVSYFTIITCGIGAEKVMTRSHHPHSFTQQCQMEERGVEKLAPIMRGSDFQRFDFQFKE